MYERDKYGAYKNVNELNSFELIAYTNDVRKYMLDLAQNGFKLKDIFESNAFWKTLELCKIRKKA